MAISGGEFIEMEPEDLRSLTEALRQMGPEGMVQQVKPNDQWQARRGREPGILEILSAQQGMNDQYRHQGGRSWHREGREWSLGSVGANMGTLLMSRVDDPQDWGIMDCRPGWDWSDWLGLSLAVFTVGCGVVALWFPIPLVLRLLFLASCLGLAGVVLFCLEVFDRWPPEFWLRRRDRWRGRFQPFCVGRNPRSYLEHAHDYA